MRKMLIIECLNTCSHAYANIHAYNGICRHSSGSQRIPYLSLEIHENDVGTP